MPVAFKVREREVILRSGRRKFRAPSVQLLVIVQIRVLFLRARRFAVLGGRGVASVAAPACSALGASPPPEGGRSRPVAFFGGAQKAPPTGAKEYKNNPAQDARPQKRI